MAISFWCCCVEVYAQQVDEFVKVGEPTTPAEFTVIFGSPVIVSGELLADENADIVEIPKAGEVSGFQMGYLDISEVLFSDICGAVDDNISGPIKGEIPTDNLRVALRAKRRGDEGKWQIFEEYGIKKIYIMMYDFALEGHLVFQSMDLDEIHLIESYVKKRVEASSRWNIQALFRFMKMRSETDEE